MQSGMAVMTCTSCLLFCNLIVTYGGFISSGEYHVFFSSGSLSFEQYADLWLPALCILTELFTFLYIPLSKNSSGQADCLYGLKKRRVNFCFVSLMEKARDLLPWQEIPRLLSFSIFSFSLPVRLPLRQLPAQQI